jgi:TP901 family phage tail tape measure protein
MFQVVTGPATAAAQKFFSGLSKQAQMFGAQFNGSQNQLAAASYRTGRLGGIGVGLIGSALSRAGRSLTGLGVSMLATMGTGVEAAGNFEVGMAKLSAVTEGNVDEMKALRQSALDFDKAGLFSAQEKTEALLSLAQAGFTAKEANEALIPTLDFVGASMGTLTTEQGALMAVMARKTLGLTESQLPGFFDKLAVATQVSNLNFEDLNGLFARIAATGVTMKNSTVGSLLAIAAAGKNAGKTNKDVGNSIASIANGFAGLNKEVMEISQSDMKTGALAKLGMSPEDLKDAQGNWKNVLSITADMTRRQQAMGMNAADFSSVMSAVFKQNAGGLLALAQNMGNMNFDGKVLSGVDALEALGKQIDDAGVDKMNQAAEMSQKFADTWEGIKKQLFNVWEGFKVVLGETVLPLLKEGLDVVLRFAKGLAVAARDSILVRVAILGVTFAVGTLTLAMGLMATAAGTAAIAVGFIAGVLAIYDAAMAIAEANTFLFSAALVNLQIILGTFAAEVFPFMLVGLLLMIPLLMFATAALVAWRYNIGGFADSVTEKFALVSNAVKVLFAFLNGEKVPLKMGKMLFEQTPLLGKFVIAILNLKYRLQQLWEGFKEGLMPALENVGPAFKLIIADLKLAAKMVLGFFGISAASMGASKSWRDFGLVLGTLVGWLVDMGRVLAIIGAAFVAVGATIWRVFAELFEMVYDFFRFVQSGFWMIPKMIVAAFTDTTLTDVFSDHLQKLKDILPGSEPKDTSSPLYGLGNAGAAILGNIAAGMLAFAPSFGAMAAGALSTAVGPGPGNPAMSAVVASAPTAQGSPAVAAGAAGGGITVSIGQMVFQAAELSPAEAQKFARMVSDQIAAELAIQMSSSVT